MNISKITVKPLSFKAVERDGAKKAIELANGNCIELAKAKRLIAGQKDNTEWDIASSGMILGFNFFVHKRNEGGGKLFETLQEACDYATVLNARSEVKKCASREDYFNKLSEEILAEYEK